MRTILLGVLFALFSTGAPAFAEDGCPAGNLLEGQKVSKSYAAQATARMTDKKVPEEGGHWKTNRTSILNGPKAFVIYDLGQVTTVRALMVQADNNDTYELMGSVDGTTFTPVWTVPHHPQAGMRTRTKQGLTASVRYLRLGQAKGDNSYSIGEFQAFCQVPSVWPPVVEVVKAKAAKGKKGARKIRLGYAKVALGFFGLIGLVGLFIGRKEEEPWRRWLTPVGGAGALLYTAWRMVEEPKLKLKAGAEIDVLGLYWPVFFAVGFIALAVGWTLWQRRTGDRFWPTVERFALVAIVLASGSAWTNFGTFHGSRKIHYWDTFHYYMGSKYFKETGYHLLYECALVAEVEDGRLAEMKKRKLRDLRDNKLGPALPAATQSDECMQAFQDPERWGAFKQDLRLFRGHMGSAWWKKMFKDHGYNATPVWNMMGSGISNLGWREIAPPPELENSPANLRGRSKDDRKEIRALFKQERDIFETRIGWHVLIDGLLYCGIFLLILWAFGLRAMTLAILVWGVGYPWAYFWTGGSFGRVPWLFMATAGMCFMKKGKPLLGGFAITWSALLRVFPGALAGGVVLKLLWDLKARRLPKAHLRIIIGAVLALVTLIPASLPSSDGIGAYTQFIENSMKHKRTPLTNLMGMPTLLAYHPDRIAKKTKNSKLVDPFLNWKKAHTQTIKDRRWLQGLLMLGFFGLVFYLGRRMEDWEVTALSTVFIMGIFELTCYYFSFIVLMAPLALKRLRYIVALVGMSITTQLIHPKVGWYDVQYTWESLAVMGTVVYILVDLAYCQWRDERAQVEAAPAEVAAETQIEAEAEAQTEA